jgi:hypothetical protein
MAKDNEDLNNAMRVIQEPAAPRKNRQATSHPFMLPDIIALRRLG